MHISGTRNTASQPIRRVIYYWLAALLLLAEMPHYLNLPWWVSMFGAVVIVGKCLSIQHTRGTVNARLLSAPVLALVAMFAAVAVRLHYGYFLGRDPCVAFLFLLISCKFAESKTNKDVTLVLCLSAFLLFTQYFYSQTILSAVITIPAVLALGCVLIVLRGEKIEGTIADNLRLTCKLLLHGAPIAALLFLLFPRLPGPLWDLPHDTVGKTGLSETMQPGTISALSLSSDVAFRVEFDTAPPPQSDRYWRGPVLSVFDGRSWGLDENVRLAQPISDDSTTRLNYTVTLEPHNQRWLFALDVAAALPSKLAQSGQSGSPIGSMLSNFQMIAPKPITESIRYRQSSIISDAFIDSKPDRHTHTRVGGRNPRTMDFAQALRRQSANPMEFATKLLYWFRDQPFYYTLQPKLLGNSPVDEFLFDTRSGFCEHYASAMATVFRLASIPARVVTGYQGGEMNGNYMIVRQSDAHAWVEAWIQGAWRRFDPTAMVAPERVEQGLAASLGAGEPVPLLSRGGNHWLSSLQLRWDAMNYNWKRFVIDFDNQSQTSFWQSLGLPKPKLWQIASLILLCCGVWSWFVLQSSLGQTRTSNADTRLWRAYCARLKKAGLPRFRSEGPRDYHARSITAWPEHAQELEEIASALMYLRYAGPESQQRDMLRKRVRGGLRRLPKLHTL